MEKVLPIGLSTNPSFYFEGEDLIGEKGKLLHQRFELTGSSPNIGKALYRFGLNPMLVVPFEKENNLSHQSKILDFLLDELEIAHVRIKVLDIPPFAVVPFGSSKTKSVLYGQKGAVTTDEILLSKAEQQINGLNGKFRVLAGIDKSLARLALRMLGVNSGFRTFSPHHTLCSKENRSILLQLLHSTDELILNESEFDLLGMNLGEIHKAGVKIIIVTAGENGGFFSLSNESNNFNIEKFSYEAVRPNTSEIYLEGAGDSFNAAQVFWIVKNKLDFNAIKAKEAIEACKFAASISSQKITVRGASNYPDNLII